MIVSIVFSVTINKYVSIILDSQMNYCAEQIKETSEIGDSKNSENIEIWFNILKV